MKSVRWLVALSVLMAAGCGGSGDRPSAEPSASAAHADSVAFASSQITAEMFDTINWPADSAALARGAVVWTFSCRRCHGDEGHGDGGFVQGGDTIVPPSLREYYWRYAEDRDGLRRQIYTGTAEGMPHWGLVGLKPRDVDAVALYIQRVLRQQ